MCMWFGCSMLIYACVPSVRRGADLFFEPCKGAKEAPKSFELLAQRLAASETRVLVTTRCDNCCTLSACLKFTRRIPPQAGNERGVAKLSLPFASPQVLGKRMLARCLPALVRFATSACLVLSCLRDNLFGGGSERDSGVEAIDPPPPPVLSVFVPVFCLFFCGVFASRGGVSQ